MTTRKSPHAAGKSESTHIVGSAEAAGDIAAWQRMSRFCSVAMVLDFRAPGAAPLLRTIRSRDARQSLRLARATGSRFAVCCGQLLRKKAGVFMMGLRDEANLPAATAAGFTRLTEEGEAHSLWIVMLAEPLRSEIVGALADLSAVEGSA